MANKHQDFINIIMIYTFDSESDQLCVQGHQMSMSENMFRGKPYC